MSEAAPNNSTATPTAASLPRWLLILGAVVSMLATVWSMVSPKVESAKPPATPASAPSVSISGSGNVGVGVMSGGSINNGKP